MSVANATAVNASEYLNNHPVSSAQALDLTNPTLSSDALKNITQNIFGAKEWKKCFDVEMKEIEFDAKLLNFLRAKDAIDPTKYNYETHLPPIQFPESFIKLEDETESFVTTKHPTRLPYNLQTLKVVRSINKKGTIYDLKLKDDSKTEPMGWLVVRKELLFREMSHEEQAQSMKKLNEDTSVGYERLPSALQIATVLLVQHVFKNQCFFINTGRCRSVSLCKDELNHEYCYPTHVVCDCRGAWNGVTFDSFDPNRSRMSFDEKIYSNHIGVMAIKKFCATPPPDSEEKECGDWVLVERLPATGNKKHE